MKPVVSYSVSATIIGILWLIPTVSFAVSSRQATHLTIDYVVTIAGFRFARGAIHTEFDRNRFKVTGHGRASGIGRLASSGNAIAVAKGRIRKGKLQSQSYSLNSDLNDRTNTVQMSFRNGSVSRTRAVPMLSKVSDRVDVTSWHHKSVLDPLSAILIPVARKASLFNGAKICNRNLKIFDGRQRFDIRLTYIESKEVQATREDQYSGIIHRCRVRYSPVAGHRRGKKNVVALMNNKTIEAWFAPVGDLPVAALYHASMESAYGVIRFRADKFVAR